MQIVRTIVWVLLLVALLIFSVANWEPAVTVRIWENLVVETKVPAIVIVSFLIGFVPMWLIARGTKWHYRRRIASLESAVRTSAETPHYSAPATPAGIVTPAEEPRDDMFLRETGDLPPPEPDTPGTPRP